MKKVLLFLCFMLVLTVTSSYSQVSNLKVLGSTSNFSIASGDLFGWSFNVPNAGDTTLIQIWVDADQNGVLNPSVDVLWIYFNQIDGDPRGQSGPPDIDGSANKSVAFESNLGLAPAHYILLFKNHNKYATIAGTVASLASPAFTISGTVTVAAGYSKKNIMMSLESEGDNNTLFWNGLTDENGNFAIQMSSDTAGNPWNLRPNNNLIFGAGVLSPREYSLVITPGITNYSGKNFTVTAPAATIRGKLKDENGNPIIGSEVHFSAGNFYRYAQTDTVGVYKLGLLTSELPQSNLVLQSDSKEGDNAFSAFAMLNSVKSGDALYHDLTVFQTNSTVSGKVTIDGKAPNFGLQMFCMNSDTAITYTFTNSDGSYSFNVSNKIYNYIVGATGYIPAINASQTIIAHPGQTDRDLKFLTTTSDVKQGNSSIPAEFSLSQNYPNPFNPLTTINYSVAKAGYVRLSVYNLIGSKVATLVSENKAAGKYSVQFDGSNLPSGIYLYRLEAGGLVADKKLVILK